MKHATCRRWSVAAAVVTIAGTVLAASPAAAAPVAPALTGLRVVGASPVVVTSGPATVGVTARFTGGTAGLASISVTAGCGSCSGSTTSVTQTAAENDTIVAGDASAGVVTVDLTVPQTATAGSWSVTGVTLAAADTTTTTYASGDLSSYAGTDGFTVSRTANTTPPSVGTISFPNGPVSVTTSDADVVVDVALTDSVPGVASGSVALQRGSDTTTTKTLGFTSDDLVSGSVTNGVFQATDPGGWLDTDAGTWHVVDVTATDGYGNAVDDSAPSSPPSIVVTAAADTTSPAIAASPPSGFAPSTVDVTTAGGMTTFNARITDAGSGFVSGSGTLSDGKTADAIGVSISPADRVSGTVNDGRYAVTVAVPARQAAGTYHFTDLTLADRYGNSGEGAALASLPALTVGDTADSAGPALGSLTIGPAKVNVDIPGAQAGFVAHVTDAVSGVSEVDIALRDSSAATSTVALTPASLIAGSTRSGTLAAAEPVAALALGTVTVTGVTVTDLAGNHTSYTPSQLTALSASTSFSLVDQVGDTTAPTVSSLALSPASVSTTGGAASVALTVAAADAAPSGIAPTGISSVSVTVAPPGGDDAAVTTTLRPQSLVSGNPDQGSFAGTLRIPQYAVNGAWSVTGVTVTDLAGNTRSYSGSALSGAGAAKAVTVTGPTDHQAPTVTSLTGPATINTSTGAAAAQFVVGYADDASGVCQLELTATSPSTDQQRQATFTTGTCATSGQATLSITFPQYAESGAWTLSAVVTDAQGNQRDVASSDLHAAGEASSITVTPASDTHPPAAVALSFDPSSVSVTSADTPVVVDAHLTDQGSHDGSGVVDASLVLTQPDGTTTVPVPLRLVAGSTQNGYYQGGFVIPQFGETGQWAIASVTAHDLAGNELDLSPSGLTTAGLPTSLTVSGTTDDTPPAIASIGFTPASVSITGHDGLSTLALHLTDDASGVQGATFDLIGPDSTDLPEQTGSGPVSGTPTDGIWDVPIDIPAYSATGKWQIDNLAVSDTAGNVVVDSTSDLSTAGLTTGITVTGTPDTAAPVLTGLSFSPSPVSVSAAAVTVTATATITDDASGFGGGLITVTSPGGSQVTGQLSATAVSGSTTSGTFHASLTIPKFAPAGAWSVTDVDLFDNVGHQRDYPTASLPSVTAVAKSLTVTDTAADTKPPALVSIGLSRAKVDAGIGQSDENISLHITDDRSGVASGSLTLQAPSGLTTVYPLPSFDAGGSPTSGVYEIDVPFTAADELGTWTISNVSLTDVIGNSVSLTGSKLPKPTTFEVATTANPPGAPRAVTVTPAAGQATLSWTAPADDGGAPVSGYAVTVKPAPKGAHAVTVNGSTRTATVTGLVSGTSYAFTVDASNRVKGKGPASSKVTLAGTRVTVKAPLRPVTVAAGKAARITATVTNSATKKPVAHRAVTLLSRVVGTTTWARTASAKTNAKGTVALTVKPRSNTQYELAFAGVTNALAGSLSRTVVVGVAPKVTIAATSRSAKHGAAVMIYGTTSPADTGAVVHLQVLVGRTWKPLAVKAVVSSQLLPNHHTAVGYVLTYQPTKRGKQSLRVAVAATSSYGASLSGRLSLTVR